MIISIVSDMQIYAKFNSLWGFFYIFDVLLVEYFLFFGKFTPNKKGIPIGIPFLLIYMIESFYCCSGRFLVSLKLSNVSAAKRL